MANNVLLVVDVQNGFINRETAHIPQKIRNLLDEGRFKNVIFTKFINQRGSFYETEIGWHECYTSPDTDIVPDLVEFAENIIVKHGYTSFTQEFRIILNEIDAKTIYIVGIETDACVLKTALDAIEMNCTPIVLKDLCASMSGNIFHENALDLLKKLIGSQNVQ